MAVSTIESIASWMNSAIKATTPDVRSGIPYRKASGSAPLQEQEPNGRDSQRQFQCQMAPITGLGDFVGPCYELNHEITVVMRYVMDGRNRDDWDDLQLMAADDAKRIVLALTRPPISAPWSDAGIFNIVPVDHAPIQRNDRWDGVWEQSITFGVLYADEANTRDFECITVYANYTALSATNGTTTWLGSSRAEVRRLTDGTLYFWDGSAWALFAQPGDVPAFADLTAIEAATLYGDKVAYSTADTRLARVESSVARLLFDEGDVATYASTTAMEAATLYGDKLGDIGGGVYQIQGGTAVALTSGSAGTITDVNTVAEGFALSAPSAGDRFCVVNSVSGAIVGVWRYDGTFSAWVPTGKIDLVAAGAQGGTIFGSAVTGLGTPVTPTWDASGYTVSSASLGSSFLEYEITSVDVDWVDVSSWHLDLDYTFTGAGATNVLSAYIGELRGAVAANWNAVLLRTSIGLGSGQLTIQFANSSTATGLLSSAVSPFSLTGAGSLSSATDVAWMADGAQTLAATTSRSNANHEAGDTFSRMSWCAPNAFSGAGPWSVTCSGFSVEILA